MGEAKTQEEGPPTVEGGVVDASNGAVFIVVQKVPENVQRQAPRPKTTSDNSNGLLKSLVQRPRRGLSFFGFRRRETEEPEMKVVREQAPLPGSLADVESDRLNNTMTSITQNSTTIVPFSLINNSEPKITPLNAPKPEGGRNQEGIQDISLLYNLLNTREKGQGDFTSVNFEDEEDMIIPTSDSLPQLQHRPIPRPTTGDGKALFVTSNRLPARLLSGGVGDEKQINLEWWMSSLPSALHRVPLNHLYIPGSHDSFSYSLSTEGGIGPDAPSQVTPLARFCPCLTLPALLRWSVTQREEVMTQLRHGIRYFDIRVAKRDSRFYFVHGLYGDDLQTLLSEIQVFVSQHPGEVVLLDFQHFHGLTKEDHAALTTLLRRIFTTSLCPTQHYQPTLSYLADKKYQVLVFYRDNKGREGVPWLWPSYTLPNPWPDTTSVQEMLKFLEDKLTHRDSYVFFVTQCVLTPSSGYLSRHWAGRLESLARRTNQAIPPWLDKLPTGPPGANVVMSDFVEQDNWAVPRAVISKNYTRLNY